MKLLQQLKSFFSSSHESNPTKIKRGVLRYFNRSKGYGFIRSKETTKDVFVHISEFEERIRIGDPVEFEIDYVPKGLSAKNVSLAEK